MKEIDYQAAVARAMEQIRGSGAFLTVKSGDRLNTMTIGWAMIGFVWRKPQMMVAVRDSRHTFGLIEEADDFTVSIPSTDMAKALAFCGSRSGRDCDKFTECGLATTPAAQCTTPIIDTAGLHYECRIVLRSAMDPRRMARDYESVYPQKDYHTLYFGEIVACYER